MRCAFVSGTSCIRATISFPAILRSASISSPIEAVTPGIISDLRSPNNEVSNVAACSAKPTAERGEAKTFLTSFVAGSIASNPTSGSRIMFEKSPDAALFGAPGRTQIEGKRSPTPSKNPRLL